MDDRYLIIFIIVIPLVSLLISWMGIIPYERLYILIALMAVGFGAIYIYYRYKHNHLILLIYGAVYFIFILFELNPIYQSLTTPDRIENIGVINDIRIYNPRLINTDDDSSFEAIELRIQPRDAYNHYLRASGELNIVIKPGRHSFMIDKTLVNETLNISLTDYTIFSSLPLIFNFEEDYDSSINDLILSARMTINEEEFLITKELLYEFIKNNFYDYIINYIIMNKTE